MVGFQAKKSYFPSIVYFSSFNVTNATFLWYQSETDFLSIYVWLMKSWKIHKHNKVDIKVTLNGWNWRDHSYYRMCPLLSWIHALPRRPVELDVGSRQAVITILLEYWKNQYIPDVVQRRREALSVGKSGLYIRECIFIKYLHRWSVRTSICSFSGMKSGWGRDVSRLGASTDWFEKALCY